MTTIKEGDELARAVGEAPGDLTTWHPHALGDPVEKAKGFPFKGFVVARFMTSEGKPRVVVEHEAEVGMLHIYAPDQLRPRNAASLPLRQHNGATQGDKVLRELREDM